MYICQVISRSYNNINNSKSLSMKHLIKYNNAQSAEQYKYKKTDFKISTYYLQSLTYNRCKMILIFLLSFSIDFKLFCMTSDQLIINSKAQWTSSY